MPVKLIKYAFSAGKFAKDLLGRNDLEKYDLGVAEISNFFIDYRGGMTSRPGTELADQIDSSEIRFFSFMFNKNVANTYLLVFTPLKLRFVQDGAYVLEAAKAITSIVSNTVGVTTHGFANNDLVKIGARTFVIGNVTTSTFDTFTFAGAAATPVGSEASRVYTVTTPYDTGDLVGLQFRQRRDTVIITSLDFAPMDLTRSAHTSWALTDHDFGGTSLAAPTGITGTPTTAGTASTNITVTAVDHEGRETTLSSITQVDSMVNYSDDPGSLLISWTAVAGAKYYNVYRSLIFPTAAQNSLGQQLGYIGRSYGTSFTDVNVIPDFKQTPPQYANPFVANQVQFIEVTAGGSGYTSAPTVSVTGSPGSGFIGIAILNADAVSAVIVLNGGSGYSSPVVGFTGGGGSGATATASLSPSTGIAPAVSVFYGQRHWFMGTAAYPMTLFSGRANDIYSFNRGQLVTANDPYELELDSPELTPISFAETLLDNLFIFTDLGVWQMAPTEAGFSATQRTRNGIGMVPPLPIDTELIFALPDGSGVRAMRPGQVPNNFTDVDLTIFSGDYFTAEQQITAWGFARTPFRIVWARKADDKFLSFTYVPEHNVYAWAEHSTRGRILEMAVVNESGVDRTYFAVERSTGTFIERLAHRIFPTVEDIWSVDCALASTLTYPAATLTVAADGTCTASSSVFSSGDVGAHLRAGGGRGVVTAYSSATAITIEFITPIAERAPQTDDFPEFAEGDWSLTPTATVFEGLTHLVGETVEVLADGSYFGDFVVAADGTITLDAPASYVIAGLGFDGFFTTLPPSASDQEIDDRRKRIIGLALRCEATRGLRYGVDDVFYEMKEKTDENYGEATRFQSGLRSLSVRADWRTDGQITVRKEGPSAISVLGLVLDMAIGDDPQ